MDENLTFDVVIVGGGAAGASAAMVLGRARASVLLVDAGSPSNLASTGIGGLLGHDGTPPAEFYEQVDTQLAAYPTIVRRSATVTSVSEAGEAGGGASGQRRRLELDDGSTVITDRVLLAMGMRYAVPEIDGIEPLWGASVFHCPFCHGWEHRDQPLAVLGNGEMPVERAALLRQWSDDVTLVTGSVDVSVEERADLERLGVPVVVGAVASLVGDGRELTSVVMADGSSLEVTGMLIPAPHEQRVPALVESLGVDLTPMGHVAVDMFGATSVPGVWAAGDITSPMASVARVVAEGSLAAVGVVRSLVDARLAG